MSLKKPLDNTLGKLIRQWYPAPRKSLKPSIINEVHKIINEAPSAVNLDTLLITSYFEHVLWPNFNPDVTVNQIELMLVLCLHSYNTCNLKIIDAMIADGTKLDQFIHRLLVISFDLRQGSNFYLHKLIMFFFSQLVLLLNQRPYFNTFINNLLNISMVDHHSTASTSFESKWVLTMFLNNIKLLHEIKNVSYTEYLSSFLYFLLVCVSRENTQEKLSEFLRLSSILYYFNFEFENYTLGKLKMLLLPFIHQENVTSNFMELKKVIYSNIQDPKKKSLTTVASIYEITPQEIKENLNLFDQNELLLIVRNLGNDYDLPTHISSRQVLISFIINYASLSVNNHQSLTDEISYWTEKELFDEFVDSSEAFRVFPFLPLPDSSYESVSDYFKRERAKASSQCMEDFHLLLMNVLNRVKISTDSSNKLTIKGKSKNFFEIDSWDIDKSEFSVKNTLDADFKDLNFILLLEITPLNKYSNTIRQKKFGLELLRVGRILSFNQDNKSKIKLYDIDDKVCSRLNYFIRIPSSFNLKKLIYFIKDQVNVSRSLPKSVEDVLLGKASNSLVDPKMTNLKLNCFNRDQMQKIYNFTTSKRRKLDKDSSSNNVLLKFSEDSDITDYEISNQPNRILDLNVSQIQAVINGMRMSLSIVNTPPHSGIKRLLDGLTSNLNLNFPREKIVVICPNNTFIENIEMSSDLSSISCKLNLEIDSKIDEVFGFIEELLQYSETVSRCLGLDESIYSENCGNAMHMYNVNVKGSWQKFLKELQDDRKNISNYPFKSLNITDTTIDELTVTKSYFEIVSKFEVLNRLAPIMNLHNNKKKIMEYLVASYFQIIYCTPEDFLLNVHGINNLKFESVIALECHKIPQLMTLLPIFNNDIFKRLILFGDLSSIYNPNNLLWKFSQSGVTCTNLKKSYLVNPELFELYKPQYPNVELITSYEKPKKNIKQSSSLFVSKDNSQQQVSVNQAKFCIELFKSIVSLETSHKRITVVCMSPYQKALIEEISEHELKKNQKPVISLINEICCNDYIILSLWGNKTNYDVMQVIKYARLGVYLTGETEVFPNISKSLDITKVTSNRVRTIGIKSIEDFKSVYRQK